MHFRFPSLLPVLEPPPSKIEDPPAPRVKKERKKVLTEAPSSGFPYCKKGRAPTNLYRKATPPVDGNTLQASVELSRAFARIHARPDGAGA